jgi:UDP-N-acetyl-2-amino-2-deoxyglucuronate dehydrogenase
MKKNLRFLLVGCGHIGGRHAQIISEQALLAGVCDTVAEKARKLGEEFDVPYFKDFGDMLQAIEADAVSICTPNGLHAQHSIEALNHSLHVLCEKPMAIRSEDCRNMMEAAQKNNRLLMVVKQNRHNPPVRYLKQLLDEGVLGKIYSIQVNCFWNRDAAYYRDSWKGTLGLDGGVLFTQFSHFIDIMCWMFGDVRKIDAISANSAHQGLIEFDDNGTVCLEFENGVIGGLHYTVNTSETNVEGSLTVIAENGTIKIGGKYLNRLEYHHVKGIAEPTLPEGNRANQYTGYEGSMGNHSAVYAEFIEMVAGNRYSSNGADALRAVEIIERIHLAARKNP